MAFTFTAERPVTMSYDGESTETQLTLSDDDAVRLFYALVQRFKKTDINERPAYWHSSTVQQYSQPYSAKLTLSADDEAILRLPNVEQLQKRLDRLIAVETFRATHNIPVTPDEAYIFYDSQMYDLVERTDEDGDTVGYFISEATARSIIRAFQRVGVYL